MSPADVVIFNNAVEQAQAGEQTQAYAALLELAARYPHEADLLLWCASTAPDIAMARALVEGVANVAPQHPRLSAAQAWLAQQGDVSPISASKSSAQYSSMFGPRLADPLDNVPVVMPKAKKRRKGFYTLIAVEVLIAVLVVVGFIIVPPLVNQILDEYYVPAPPNSRRLEDAFTNAKNLSNVTKGIISKSYATTTSAADVQVFYQKKLAERGWKLLTSFNTSGNIQPGMVYIKGQRVAVITIGATSEVQLKAGETVCVVTEGTWSDFPFINNPGGNVN